MTIKISYAKTVYGQEEIDAASLPNTRDRTVATITGMPTVGNAGLASATDAEFGDPIDEYLEDPFKLNGIGELQFQLWNASPIKGGTSGEVGPKTFETQAPTDGQPLVGSPGFCRPV